MGIQGLLPLLKSIMVPIHIKELEGSYVAVDTYSWLHKGALSCSRDLCKALPTTRHIEYCMHRVNLLRHHGVKPVLVFDGGLLPMKIEQENKRARVRKENLSRAIEHESEGNSSAAYECYQKAVDISPLIACELIQVLKRENVSYVVAPYEADAQMTFLAVSKQVEAVITEDSDLIPFGCPRIIFKMDKFGQGVEFQNSMLQQNKDLSFAGFNKQMLLEMCILSGCDYLQSLPGMGLKRAHALIKKFKSYDKTENVCADLVLDKTSQLKQFNPDSVRKKLDLPVQKNLLTKYFCFASLEAKRKFRAPRVSPNHPSPEDNSSLSPNEYITVDAAECKTNCSPASLLESKNMGTVPLANNPVEDDLASEVTEFSDMVAETRSPEHTLLQQPQYSIQEPCTALHKEQECKTIPHAVEGKTRTETGKVVVRSSYFLHKSENRKDPINNQEKINTNGLNDVYENTIPENASFRNNHLKDTVMKRKTSPNDCVENENVQPKLRCADAALPDNGYCAPNPNRTSTETEATEEKFGSNISHLSHYSEIAEKSMEKFVSVITSFRCSSSGSRASGLRAPMKDVQNTCSNRPTNGVDFSRFAYAPKNRKTALASRRG
uniref:Exonuclease 1 n=1 Tax=Fagus sylvatica TaxID=28930 RepID=A0A2N9I662_FAGSY